MSQLPDAERQALPIETLKLSDKNFVCGIWSYKTHVNPNSIAGLSTLSQIPGMSQMGDMMQFDQRYIVLSFFEDDQLFYREFYPDFSQADGSKKDFTGFLNVGNLVKSLAPARLRYVAYLKVNRIWPVLPDFSKALGLEQP